MFKTIEIEYMEGSMVNSLIHSIQNEDFLEEIELDEDNNIIKITYDDSEPNFMGIIMMSAVSIFLCADYVMCYSKYKNKENESQMLLSTIASDVYFANTLLIQLINYFQLNTRLKESVFFRFNMPAFGKELDVIVNDYQMDNIMKKASKDMHNILKTNGLNFKRFSTLKIHFDEDNCFQLVANDGTILTPESTMEAIGLQIEFEEQEDDFLTMILFSNMMISILETKTLIIPKDCEDFYEAMQQQALVFDNNVSLVVAD